MTIEFMPQGSIDPLPDGGGWCLAVTASEGGEDWAFNACVPDRGQSHPTWDAIEADLRALAGDDYMRGVAELRENEQPALSGLAGPTIWVLDARQWRVTFSGHLGDQGRAALADAGFLHSGGHSGAGFESNTVYVEAVGAADAINRVRDALEPHGPFGRWQAGWVADEHRL